MIMLLLFFLILLGGSALTSCSAAKEEEADDIHLRIIKAPGVILHKTAGPLEEGPVEDSFPGTFPARFIRQAYGIDAPDSIGGKKIIANQSGTCESGAEGVGNVSLDEQFGAAILSRAKEMFSERNYEDELEAFLRSGVSNPDAGPRRMYWAGIDILPNHSLALHSHPNVEFVYIVEGTMHEYRIVDNSIEKKKKYACIDQKCHGPDYLVDIDASKEGIFQHKVYKEGEMFINVIGDVHQSFSMEEGVKLLAMWGDGNADIPGDKYPQNSAFLNKQSAKAWDL